MIIGAKLSSASFKSYGCDNFIIERRDYLTKANNTKPKAEASISIRVLTWIYFISKSSITYLKFNW